MTVVTVKTNCDKHKHKEADRERQRNKEGQRLIKGEIYYSHEFHLASAGLDLSTFDKAFLDDEKTVSDVALADDVFIFRECPLFQRPSHFSNQLIRQGVQESALFQELASSDHLRGRSCGQNVSKSSASHA